MNRQNNRYRIDTFISASLEGNPLGAPAERQIRIYLPPGYHQSGSKRYPVVYLLHGNGGDTRSPIVGSRQDLHWNFPFPVRLRFAGIFRSMVGYERLDRLILQGELPPFILVQPDGSLHLPHINAVRKLNGRVRPKGSLYTDSPFTGNFGSSVFRDAVGHVDSSYRTRQDKKQRALVGGSMGGYGALLGGILHPELFCAVAALSPSIGCLDWLDVKLVVPFNRRLFGEKRAVRQGRLDLEDILDTCDLVFSRPRPLLPGLRRDQGGRAVEMDREARANWAASDLGAIMQAHPRAFEQVRLQINCEQTDEFGFAGPCRRFHGQLEQRGIAHEFELYSDPKAARFSPHTLGIAWRVLPALRFCLRHMAG